MIESPSWQQALQQLHDADPSIRRWATGKLAEGDERALYSLINLLRDSNPGVQDAARSAWVAIGGEVTAYMTLPLLRENAYLRNTSRLILRQIGAPAIPLFRHLLRDKDDDIRIFAIELIADIQSCDFPEEITRILAEDTNVNARAAAARALGRLGHTPALPVLRRALQDAEWVCVSALESLAALGDVSAVSVVAELLTQGSDAVRYSAIEALGQLASEPAKNALLGALAGAGQLEQAAIVSSLVQIGVTPSMGETYDVLVEILQSGNWDKKIIAIRGLCGLRDVRAIPLILDETGALDPSEPDNEDRVTAAIDGLIQFGCGPALIGAVGAKEIKHMGKVIAIDALATLGCAAAVPALVSLMEGDLREVRRASARALGAIRSDTATQQLRNSIEDWDGHVRRAAASALGRLKDKAAFEPLFEHLDRERYRDVYEEIVKALLAIDEAGLCERLDRMEIPGREIIARHGCLEPTLLALADDEERSVRLAAVAGLANVSSAATVARLEVALRDPDPEVRRTAVLSLGRLNRKVDAVRRLLDDEDVWVRRSVATVLGEIDGQS